MPKIEVHRHLEGGIRPTTAWKLAQTQHIDLGFADYPSFENVSLIRGPIGGLGKVLEAMALTRKILASAAAIEEVAFQCVRDAKADNIKLFELRFAPALLAQASGLDYPKVIAAVASGVAKATAEGDIQVGLICSLRRTSPKKANEAIVKAMLDAKTAALPVPLVGVDLSDNEWSVEPEAFAGLFDTLREAGFGITVHSGLNTTPAHLWRTIQILKPQRIGHGIVAIQEPALMDEIKRLGLHLEVSVLSNWITEAVPGVKDHPLPRLLEAGISVGINSDDPGLFSSSLNEEYELLERTFGLSTQDFITINLNTLRSSFLPKAQQDMVRDKYFSHA